MGSSRGGNHLWAGRQTSDSSRSRSRDRGRKDKDRKKKDKERSPKKGGPSPARKEVVKGGDDKKEKVAEKPRERSRSGGKRNRSMTPPPTKIHIGRLTRNVNRDHLLEIFSTFGKIKEIEFGSERMRPWLNKGFAYIEYDNP